jgi:hypothetical protein
MGLVVFLAVVGALTIYAFHFLFDAPGWGFLAALALFILGMDASARSQSGGQKSPRRLPLPPSSRAAATAAGVAMIVGIAVGWLVWGRRGEELSASDFVRVENQRLLATAPLKAVLDTVPSGRTPVPLDDRRNAHFLVKMTFQNQTHGYCRQYELAMGERPRMAGIACRIPSGDWLVMLQSLLPPSRSGVTVPASAGGNAALDAAISALIDGDPLIGEAEAAIIRNGWAPIKK